MSMVLANQDHFFEKVTSSYWILHGDRQWAEPNYKAWTYARQRYPACKSPFRKEWKLALLVHFSFALPSSEVLPNHEGPFVCLKYKSLEGQGLVYYYWCSCSMSHIESFL